MPEPEGSGVPEPKAPGAPTGAATSRRASPKRAARRARLLRWWHSPPLRWAIAVVVFLFILEYALLPDIANAHKALHDLSQVNIGVLFVAVALEVLSLVAYAELSHAVLSPDAPRRSVLLRVNLSSMAVSHVVPGGTAPGTAVGYRLLTELDVPSSTAAFGLGTQGVGSAVVLNAIFWCALLISIPLNGYNPLYGFAALAGLILFALFAGTVLLLTRGQRQALERLHGWTSKVPVVNADKVTALVQTIADRLQVLLRDRALVRRATGWATANWLFDAASLWVFLLAFHHLVSPIDLLVAYGLANILAVIPITPSGLGVVEGVLIPSLVGFHMPRAIATLAVLSYRLVNFWLPIPAGGVAYLSLRSRSDLKARRRLRIQLHRGRPDRGLADPFDGGPAGGGGR
ncbi:MAG: lysylphosphatidylglycerol synthase transmembrane domain-containing protein [Acidimicrobiales bacterium]